MRVPHNERLSADPQADTPERTCILTGGSGARGQLIRLAIAPDGPDGTALVLPDVLARAAGRGAWIGVTRAELEAAMGPGKANKLKSALARAHKGAVLTIPDDLPDRITAALTRALTERLGLALRAGQLLLGSDRIAEAARAGRVAWLAHAHDASPDGCRKLDAAWRVGRDEEGSGLAGVTLPLDRAALSVALGRDNVVHLALGRSAAAGRVAALAGRLLHFCGPDAAPREPEPNPRAAAAAVGDDDDEMRMKDCVST